MPGSLLMAATRSEAFGRVCCKWEPNSSSRSKNNLTRDTSWGTSRTQFKFRDLPQRRQENVPKNTQYILKQVRTFYIIYKIKYFHLSSEIDITHLMFIFSPMCNILLIHSQAGSEFIFLNQIEWSRNQCAN